MRRPGAKDGGPGNSCGQQGKGEGIQGRGFDRLGEASTRSRNLYGADRLLAGQRIRPMKQRRLMQRKPEMPLVVYACIGIFMRICLSYQGVEM
jgi:hypothetical protein